MPIDINLLRVDRGGNPEIVRESEIKRGRDGSLVDIVIDLDKKWRQLIFSMEAAKKEMNLITREIGKGVSKEVREELVQKASHAKQTIKNLEIACTEAKALCDKNLCKIGNLVHASVVKSNDEKNNKIITVWKEACIKEKMLLHHEIMEKLQMINLKKGAELSGHRGYFLKGVGVMLNMALINYGLSFLRKRGYTDIQPPYFIRREIMQETAELGDFSENLYQIPISKNAAEDKDDLLLIATSEQPISALHRGEFVDPKSLPFRYVGFSTCFRKEAGAHGKDIRGIFRVHQFEKIEQFIVSSPEESQHLHEEMLRTAQEFYESLEIPYRVISIVSGALNDAASIKYDLEAWFPGYNDYRELVSCSNCLDYQSRALEIRYGHPKQGEREKHYVHLLNGTLVATQRTMCCILENNQTPYGVRIPTVLVPYMDGQDFLPYPEKI